MTATRTCVYIADEAIFVCTSFKF